MIKIQKAFKKVSPSDMEIGNTGVIIGGGSTYLGHIVLMTFDGLVSLTDHEYIWDRDAKGLVIELRDIVLTIQ
jgi:hypothetical protein